ncbi:MAG: hypothetical protein WCL06_15950, partial [Bacteroidota bacterium]
MISYIINKVIYRLLLSKINKKNRIINESNLSAVKFEVSGSGNSIRIGNNCQLENLLISITGDNHHLLIGDNVIIRKGCIRFEDSQSEIVISKNTTIESALLSCTESGKKILIGEDCMLSDKIQIRTGDSHSIFSLVDTNKNGQQKLVINGARNISIGNHVWISSSVIILKGVQIGDNSVIGVGTIVTKNVPENCVFVGTPGKVVKKNTNWS